MLPLAIALTALCSAWTAFATPLDLSNAQRLQQGLPLKAPAKRFDASATQHLRARASDIPGGERVIQVNPAAELRKRAEPSYLVYDTVNSRIAVGTSLADALRIDSIPEGQVAGPLFANINGQRQYMASLSNGANTWAFDLVQTSDAGLPIGKTYQTSIWSYANSALSADYFSASAPKAPLYFVNSGGLVGTTDAQASGKLSLSTVLVADIDTPVIVVPRNEWYMQVVDTSNTTPGERLAYYNNQFDSFQLDGAQPPTVFSINPSPTNSSRVIISFQLDGATQLLALKQTSPPYSAYDSATISMVRTGGQTENNPYLTQPVISDGWTLQSYVPGVTGLIGQYTYSFGTSEPVRFMATTHYIAGKAINRYSSTGYSASITFVPAPAS